MTVRTYEEGDRTELIALVGDARAIDSPTHRLRVAEEDGKVVGFALWHQPDAGGTAVLGSVIVPQSGRWGLVYALVAATARDALARGFVQAQFTINSHTLLNRLQRTFTIDARPSAWKPNTDQPVEWEVTVNLVDALEQLEGVANG